MEQGKKIYLICNATGKEHSPDDLDWFKNGNKLTTEFARKIYIRKFVSLTTKTIVSILEIKNAKLSDAGMYVCRTSDLQITSRRINVLKSKCENVCGRVFTITYTYSDTSLTALSCVALRRLKLLFEDIFINPIANVFTF